MSGQQWGMIYTQTDGTAIPTDTNDPNADNIVPDDGSNARVFRQKAQAGPMNVSSSQQLALFVGDGTSLVLEQWIFDETESVKRWWMAGTATVTAAAGVGYLQSFPGAWTYVRVKTNTGTVKNYAISQV